MASWWVFVIVWLCLLSCARGEITCSALAPVKERATAVAITDFGGVGDGETLNTEAFRRAIDHIKNKKVSGNVLLHVPAGVWLTGSFNLTSNMTLYLAKDAVIKASQDIQNWPLVSPLPSYGRGRERLGGRYASLINGAGLYDVVITGENGTIDGQGYVWWNMWRQRTLTYTRPHLVELMSSSDIIISNLTFQNSPFWTIHPVYCSNVVIRNVTILAPLDSPNTDGIDPDSSSNVCIEDSYISTGDDLVAVKSGWDEYGIAFNEPSKEITIRRIAGSTHFAGIAVGSETSGGIEHVLVENITLYHVGVAIHIKTNVGRGGYIKNVTVQHVHIDSARLGIKISGDVGDHPDDKFDPHALPVVDAIAISNVWGLNILQPGLLRGIENSTFTNICLANIRLGSEGGHHVPWNCSYVSGTAVAVEPISCLGDSRVNGSTASSREHIILP